MENEIFKDVKNYEGYYQVSNFGRVKSLFLGQPKILYNNGKKRYAQVTLCKDGVQITKNIHRLIAETFIPNPKNKPCVNHIDGDKLNNRADNLEWCTQSENVNHAFANKLRNGVGENHPIAKLTEQDVRLIRFLRGKLDQREVAEFFSIKQPQVSSIMTGNSWRHVQ